MLSLSEKVQKEVYYLLYICIIDQILDKTRTNNHREKSV